MKIKQLIVRGEIIMRPSRARHRTFTKEHLKRHEGPQTCYTSHSRRHLSLITDPRSYHYPRARNTIYSLCGWSDISWSSALTGEILRLLGFRLTTRDGTTRRWRCSVARVKAGCGQQVQISERPQQWPTHLVARSTMRTLYRTPALLTRH